MAGKAAVVTGGASGLGEATARLMAAEGAQVLLADIQDERGAAVAAAIGGEAVYQHCDVTSEDEVAALVDGAVAAFGRLDVMVNNAGIIGAHGAIDEVDLAEYEFTMSVLLRSVLLGCKHAARVMKPQHSGAIVNTTSVAGVQGGLGPHVYAAAKSGVIGLTRNVAAELGAWSIRVNAIAPGKMVTPMNAAALVGDPDALEETYAAFADRTALRGRIGVADDIAQAALWLASDEAGFVSGHTLVVDGGLTTGSREAVAPGEHGRWAARRDLAREGGRSGLPT
ncbi:MAG: Dehydrogenase short-chain alcohol dehydrogenase like protein [Frankiales bacterium]|nr:Dehydrogenase short-chain alcohol dehydrogenase like protein [Frankiales bacterium]